THHTNFDAGEIRGLTDGLLRVDVPCAGIHPAKADQLGGGVGRNLVQHFPADLAIDHLAHMLFVTENEGHIEDVELLDDGAYRADADASQLQGTELSLLDHFLLAAKLHGGEHLHRNSPVRCSFELFAHADDGFDRGIAERVNVGCFEDDLVLRQRGKTARSAEAGSRHRGNTDFDDFTSVHSRFLLSDLMLLAEETPADLANGIWDIRVWPLLRIRSSRCAPCSAVGPVLSKL